MLTPAVIDNACRKGLSEVMIEAGWTVVPSIPLLIQTQADLEIVNIIQRGKPLPPDVAVRMAKERGANLGHNQAKYLLEHQKEIPKGAKSFLVFPGNIWQDPSGDHRVPCLSRSGKAWGFFLYFMGTAYWSHDFQFLRPRT